MRGGEEVLFIAAKRRKKREKMKDIKNCHRVNGEHRERRLEEIKRG